VGKADQGKRAEDRVRKWLNKLKEKRADFDFDRIPDARSGYRVKQPADFTFFTRFGHGLIEVKSVRHDYRLPAKNLTQLPKMQRRHMAGGNPIVILEHATTNLWRVIPYEWFFERRKQPSWDLRGFPAKTFDEAMEDLLRELFREST